MQWPSQLHMCPSSVQFFTVSGLSNILIPHTYVIILILTFTYLHVRMNAVMLEGLVSHHALHGAQILQSQDFQIHRNFPHKLFSSSCSDVMSWCHCSSPSTVKIGSLAIWEAASASGSFISFFGKMPNVCSPTKGSDSIQKPMLSQWLSASFGNNFLLFVYGCKEHLVVFDVLMLCQCHDSSP